MTVLRAWRATASLAFRAWPAGAVGRVAVTVVTSLAGGLVPGLALRGLLGGGGPGWMVLLAIAALLQLAIGPLWEYFQQGLMRRTTQAATQAVMRAALAPAGIEHLEVPRYADAMEAVRTNANTPALLFDWMATAVGGLAGVVASVVVLAGVHPLLVLPVAGAGALGVANAATRRRALLYLDQSLPGQRLTRRLAELATSVGAAKEVRMLGLGPWLVGQHRKESQEVARRLVAGERGPVVAAAISGVAQALLLGVGILWLIRLVATGRASSGDLALGIVVLRSAVESAGAIGVTLGSDLARNTHVARRYLWLLDYVPDLRAPSNPQPVPPRLVQGITLEHVSFAYPGCSSPVVDDVSLTLPAGSTVALVGNNGAGKSTLVKLLCRFYDPTDGRITVDGIDLVDFDPAQWLASSTGAFQDFMCLRFLACESIGAGDLEGMAEDGRIEAAARAGGAASFLDRLPARYGTQLGRDFPDGADLSQGQWQKVALSRSLMPPAPLLVLLDEPTAALDPRAEHALFERFAAEATAARHRGGIAVIVSHRFSTVRTADRIVVLDQGRVVECGTHEDLLQAEGHYAGMYRLQAARYR